MKRPIAAAIFLTFATLQTFTQITQAQTNPSEAGDPRLKATLDRLGLKYEIQNGDFKVTAKLENGRFQTAWLMSKTQKLGNLEIREIASAGYRTKGNLLTDIANRLLVENSYWKMGRWQVETGKDQTTYAVFSTKVGADTDPETLKALLNMTLYCADDMEKALTGKDVF